MSYKTGVVENIEFTLHGAGNQFTTISGVRYPTWWDIRTKDWKVGDRVSFDTYKGKLFENSVPSDCATNIRKI